MKYQKLCYIQDNWAYFTDRQLNAGIPYTDDGYYVFKIAFEGPFLTPSDIGSYSVEQINNGEVPWLKHEYGDVEIYAGASIEFFDKTVRDCGGEVYVPVGRYVYP